MKMVTLDKNQKKNDEKRGDWNFIQWKSWWAWKIYYSDDKNGSASYDCNDRLVNYSNHHFYNFRKTFLCIRKRWTESTNI